MPYLFEFFENKKLILGGGADFFTKTQNHDEAFAESAMNFKTMATITKGEIRRDGVEGESTKEGRKGN